MGRPKGWKHSEESKGKISAAKKKQREVISENSRLRWAMMTADQRVEHAKKTSEGVIVGLRSMTSEAEATRRRNSSATWAQKMSTYAYAESTLGTGQYLKWELFKKNEVLPRDNHTCCYPGCTVTQQSLEQQPWLKGNAKSLHIHHLLPCERFKAYYKLMPDLYYEVKGVITLCVGHHTAEDERLVKLSDDEVIAEFEAKSGLKLPTL
jgi:hypothetical protein